MRTFCGIWSGPAPMWSLLDRIVDGVNTDLVVEDNAGAAEEATDYLLEKYGADIGLLLGPTGISTARERLEGVQKALRRRELDLASILVFNGDYTRASGIRASDFFMSQNKPPTLCSRRTMR